MSLFSKPNSPPEDSEQKLPVHTLDVSKRYDIYSSRSLEDRLYENVRIVSIRTFTRPRHDTGVVIGGYIEIESPNGGKALLPQMHIDMICEHGQQPIYRVIADRRIRHEPKPPESK
jgi:hypothetical protein